MDIMSALSLALRVSAAAWSVALWRRLRDWRMGFLTAMLLLMALYQIFAPSELVGGVGEPTGFALGLVDLAVSLLAFLAVVFIERAVLEERRLRLELESGQAHLEQLFNNAAEGIVLADNTSHVVRVNREFTRIFGYTQTEAAGRSLDDLLAPEAERGTAREMTQCVAAGGAVNFEAVRLRKDGTPVHVSVLGTPVYVAGGQVAVYGVYRDITQQIEAERALRESEERYRTILDAVEDGYYEVDLQGNFTFFNDALQRMLGYPAERLHGMNDREYMDEENAGRVFAVFNDVYRSGVPQRIADWDIRRSDGSHRTIEGSVTLVLDAAGQPTGFRGIVRDVTERQETQRALRESEERYALAVRAANDGLWDWDLVSDAIYYSPRWKGMVGCREDEIGTDPDEWFRRVHTGDVERLQSAVKAHLEGPAPHVECEYRMLHRDGTYRWMLCRGVAVRDADGRPSRMAGSQTDISGRKKVEEQLLHDAFHDALTGLPNRALFMSLLERSLARLQRRTEYQFAVLFLDIDRFKIVNDSLGHMLGDRLLVAVARRLAACVRPGDTVARLGGDEFTVLLDDIPGADDAMRVAERVQAELAAPFTLSKHEVFATASIGIALSNRAYRRPEEVLRDADTAMYRAKSHGKARHEVFNQDMHARAVTLLRLETDLRRALDRGEFQIFYQPIIALQSGRLAGFEALLRWNHPERGLVAPVDFIQLAEETGLIIPIGEWVLWEACRTMEGWQALTPGRVPLTVSVNLSPRQFGQPTLLDSVADALAVTGLPPTSLRLEITESVLMDHAEASVDLLDELKRSGVQVQVDDFGTGYSSLSYLHRFSLDALKIDRSFVNRIGSAGGNAEIVRTIVTLAQNLGMSVVAEGVETEAQLEYLRGLSCEHAQGFLFSSAMRADEAETTVRDDRVWLTSEPVA